MTPSIGRIVHYRLSRSDCQEINRRRADYMDSWRKTVELGKLPVTPVISRMSAIRYPKGRSILRWSQAFSPATVNLQVHLDGNDTFWATSRQKATGRVSGAYRKE